ncbi:MAG TPA: ATP-binding protein [Candidatus Polarisedimenticolaceae bacterium]|nr:ATP-binding protein [Candidatus Polarisedimenticolaceae bacterium]
MSERCADCGGTGFTIRTDEAGIATAARCACAYRERGTQLLRAARIPRRYELCSFDNFDLVADELKAPLGTAKDWFESWPDRIEHGLLFQGPPGTGKTHLAVAILRDLAERKGAHVHFAEQRELLKDLQSTFDASGRSEAEVLAPVLEAEVLLLDDLGAGRTTPWAQDVMHDVLAHRYNRRLPTLMTTNRPMGDEDGVGEGLSLKDRLGDALMSRLYEMCLIVPVVAKDFRREVRHAQHRF